VKQSEKTICILAPTPELEGKILQIFRNISISRQFPFPFKTITSLNNPKDIHLLFFEVALGKMDQSRERLEQILATASPNVVLLCPMGHNELELANQFGIGNILTPESMTESTVMAVSFKLLGNVFFGFEPFFPRGFTLFEKEFRISGKFHMRELPSKILHDFITTLNEEESEYFRIYISELISNAIFYSVFGISPQERDQDKGDLPSDINIPAEKEIRVKIVRDDEKYGISITDRSGSLTLQRVLKKIQRHTTAPGEPVPRGILDLTGRGFYILSNQTRLIINILKHAKTEIIILRYNDVSLNKYQTLIINEKERE